MVMTTMMNVVVSSMYARVGHGSQQLQNNSSVALRLRARSR